MNIYETINGIFPHYHAGLLLHGDLCLRLRTPLSLSAKTAHSTMNDKTRNLFTKSTSWMMMESEWGPVISSFEEHFSLKKDEEKSTRVLRK